MSFREFNESLHPRDWRGRFARKPGGRPAVLGVAGLQRQISGLTDPQLVKLQRDMADMPGTPLDMVNTEVERRSLARSRDVRQAVVNMDDLSLKTPREIDERIVEMQEALVPIDQKAQPIVRSMARYRHVIEHGEWPADPKQLGGGKVRPATERDLAEADRQLGPLEERLAMLVEQARPYNDEIGRLNEEFRRRGGWARYYLVTNGNGHVHRETSCSTCYPTTQFSWLYTLADKPDSEMVDEFGTTACTVCFPDAPTMPGWQKAIKDKAAAEKLAKDSPEEAAKAESRTSTGWIEGPGATIVGRAVKEAGPRHSIETNWYMSRRKPDGSWEDVGKAYDRASAIVTANRLSQYDPERLVDGEHGFHENLDQAVKYKVAEQMAIPDDFKYLEDLPSGRQGGHFLVAFKDKKGQWRLGKSAYADGVQRAAKSVELAHPKDPYKNMRAKIEDVRFLTLDEVNRLLGVS